MLEILHGIAEDIAADSLDDVLHRYRTVGFDPLPFLRGSYAFIGDGFATVPVLSDARFHIGQQTGRGKFDEEHTAFIEETNPTYFGLDELCDGGFYG